MDSVSRQLRLFRDALGRVVRGPGDIERADSLQAIEANARGIRVSGYRGMSIDLLEGLPVTLTILRPPTAVRSRDEQYQWSELLYDLLAHSDPLSDLGVQLTYSRVKLADGSATAEIDLTDGIHESRTWLRLSQVGYGIADDLAMEFLDRFKSQSQGRD